MLQFATITFSKEFAAYARSLEAQEVKELEVEAGHVQHELTPLLDAPRLSPEQLRQREHLHRRLKGLRARIAELREDLTPCS